MNTSVRIYLIELARSAKRGQYNVVNYAKLIKDCKVDITLGIGNWEYKLHNMLGDISRYEFERGRPFLTSLAINKDDKMPGYGFFELAAILKEYKIKDLMDEQFHISEYNNSVEFWKDDENYRKYAFIEGNVNDKEHSFFNGRELAFFNQWASLPYDVNNPEHFRAKETIMNSVWKKTDLLAKEISSTLSEYTYEAGKYWHALGKIGEKKVGTIFKHYTWAKIYKKNTDNRVFFTIGIDKNESIFLYKIDCRRERGKNLLSKQQIKTFDTLKSISDGKITYNELTELSLNQLTDICIDFIQSNQEEYHLLLNSVINSDNSKKENTLSYTEKPEGFENPFRSNSFFETDVNYLAQYKSNKRIGSAGENLVLRHEKRILESQGMHDKAKLIEIKKDGLGFDIESYDEQGNPKYIEVKTTTRGKKTPFYLSRKEIEYMRIKKGEYFIYRIYNYDLISNSGDYYILKGDVENQIEMTPLSYGISIK